MSSTTSLPGLPFPYNKRPRSHSNEISSDQSLNAEPIVDDTEINDKEAPEVNATTPPPKRPRTTSTRTAIPKDDPPSPIPEARTPGTTLLPIARVQKIVKADKELTSASKEAVFLIAVATEEFIRRLALAGHQQAQRDGRLTVQHKDLASAVKRSEELTFLQEIIPLAIPMATALQKRQTKKVELEQQQQLLDFQKGPQPKGKPSNAGAASSASPSVAVPTAGSSSASANGAGEGPGAFGMFKLNGDDSQGSGAASVTASPTPAGKSKGGRAKAKTNGKVAEHTNGTTSVEDSREGTEATTSAASNSAADDTMEVDS